MKAIRIRSVDLGRGAVRPAVRPDRAGAGLAQAVPEIPLRRAGGGNPGRGAHALQRLRRIREAEARRRARAVPVGGICRRHPGDRRKAARSDGHGRERLRRRPMWRPWAASSRWSSRPIPTERSDTMRSRSCARTARTRSLDDLKGKIWAWAEPNSSSGYLFPAGQLPQQRARSGKAFRQGRVLRRSRAEHHRRARQRL